MNKKMKVKIIITDHWLSFQHGLFNGTECEATPYYTSTKKLKGYKVKSKRTSTDIYFKENEVEIINPKPHTT